MANTSIPYDLKIITNDGTIAHVTWKLPIVDGHESEIHFSSSMNGTYSLDRTVRERVDHLHISGGYSRWIKIRTQNLDTGEYSDFSDPLLIELDGGLEFDQAEELESLGSSLHRSNSFPGAAFDNAGNWVDVGEYTDLANFRKLHTMTYSIAGGTPVNPMFRVMEKTSEMAQFGEKVEPQALMDTATEELAIFDPLAQVQKGSSIKLQVKCDAGGANGASFAVDKLEYLDFTLTGF